MGNRRRMWSTDGGAAPLLRAGAGVGLWLAGSAAWAATGGAESTAGHKLEQAAAVLSPEGLSLLQLLRAGGWVMIVLGGLSVLALALILYFFVTLRVGRAVPAQFLERATALIDSGKFELCWRICNEHRSPIARILAAGLELRGLDRQAIHDAMQSEGARVAAEYWQQLSYLWDIAVLSPLLGILGTVLGMIKVFNAVAFQVAVVKPVALAGGVAQALVTTAAGLLVAIPTMAAYFYLRGRLQRVVVALEVAAARPLERIAGTRTGGEKKP